ncbi:phage major capsid protein [Novosphingobium album (ex Liu et al. 2023)]|uniref:Phage major capsid protein n=1 Tax=Novosphingobium album (ex Liu et al. 2023) TaxID=3031130 RepID=A0ABT5WXZ2_9SPHN|nr:phage major capsid protein [Novosphingobium album (ex Liu et al. 2023)]MDE8654778.1 phage major capsid protein [Novosphingobium album (ex Liu et al. 2023)]
MKHTSRAAMIAAGAAVVSSPRAVFAMPRADGADPKALVAQINTAFEEFKTVNNAALAGKADDAVVSEKLGKINDSINDLTVALEKAQADLAAAQLGGGGGDEVSAEVREHAGVFNTWFRKGDRAIDADLRDLEVKAKLTTQSDPDGGYLVPETMEAGIDRVLGKQSAIRSISRVINISGQTYKKLVNMGGASSGWVGEQQARTETTTPTLREIAINVHELYAQPAATQTALDDAVFNVEQWLADEVSIEFAEQEGGAFANGDGVSKPRGIFNYPTVLNDNYAWGKLGFVKTGAAAAFVAPTSELSPADCMIDLYYSLKSGYRNNASWLTSDKVLGTIRKFKDGDGNYLWAAPTGTADVPTILQKPVVTDDNVPALGANAFPVAFGDFNRGYTVVDRQGIRVLRDPYTSKPNVLFYTTKRVGGGVTNFEAIKLLKCSL